MKDYQDLLSSTFKKRNVQFDLKECLDEVFDLALYKAQFIGINVKFTANFTEEESAIDFVKLIKIDELKNNLLKINENIENHKLL